MAKSNATKAALKATTEAPVTVEIEGVQIGGFSQERAGKVVCGLITPEFEVAAIITAQIEGAVDLLHDHLIDRYDIGCDSAAQTAMNIIREKARALDRIICQAAKRGHE